MTMPGQDYASEQDRYNYLMNLRNQGVPLDSNANAFLDSYNSGGGASVGTAVQSAGAPGDLNIPEGYVYEMQARDHAMQRYVADQQAALAREAMVIDREANAINQQIAAMNAQTQRDIANLNAATQKEIAAKDRELQLQLQRGQIEHERYLQQRELAQRESEFKRDLALRTLIADREYEVQKAQLRLNELAEIREERALQAQLASNPTDFVAYELYKRMLAQVPPGTGTAEASIMAWDNAQAIAAGGSMQEIQNSLAGGPAGGGDNLIGQPYDNTGTGTHSDETMARVADSIFNQAGADWNPNLSGTGIFGSKITAPNQLSRAEAGDMTEQELGILSSFLKAGIQVGPEGKRMSIDPQEWMQQAEASWIPTLESVGNPTEYR